MAAGGFEVVQESSGRSRARQDNARLEFPTPETQHVTQRPISEMGQVIADHKNAAQKLPGQFHL